LPRFRVYVVGFALAGLPRFAAMAADVAWGTGLAPVLAVAVVGGFGAGFLNPILGAVIYERIPPSMTGRVTSLNSALCWAGIPFGGLVGGGLVAWLGVAPALLTVGSAYALVTLSPLLLPRFRAMDRRAASSGPVTVPGQAQPRSGNQMAISRSADSGESDPWTRFSRLESE
jgi:MFS family permease